MTKRLLSQAVKAVALLFFSVLCLNQASAQSWITLGNTGVPDTIPTNLALALGPDGAPYLAYNNIADNFRIAIIKYENNSWHPLGTVTDSNAVLHSLVVDHNGTIYMSYSDYADTDIEQILKYDGTSWTNITGPLHIYGQFKDPLALDNSNNLYIAYTSDTNNKVSVAKYNGNSWATVGQSDFTNRANGYFSLAVDNSNKVYVAYADYSNGSRVTVMKYDGNWTMVGSPLDTSGDDVIPIAIDNNGTPYVAYSIYGPGVSGEGVMMKYNGTNWTKVGGTNFAAATAFYCAMQIDANNNPYVVYDDIPSNSEAVVKEYNGTTWITLGNTNAYQSFYPCIVIDGTTPYIATAASTDTAFSGNSNAPTVVMRYGYPTSISNITASDLKVSLSPNPATDEVTINYNTQTAANTTLNIINITGQVVISKNLGNVQSGSETISLSRLPAGIYTMQFTSGTQQIKQKLVKE